MTTVSREFAVTRCRPADLGDAANVDPYDLPHEERIIGKFLAKWRREKPDAPYLTIGERTYSFSEVDAHARAVARGLVAQGVAKNDRVLVMLPNRAEFVFLWFGLSLIGAAIASVNPQMKGDLLNRLISMADAKGLVISDELLPILDTIDIKTVERLPWIAVLDSDAHFDRRTRCFAFSDLVIERGLDPEIEPDHRRIQMIAYTSGTTGPSKGVMMPNSHCFSLSCTNARVVGLTENDIVYAPLPLYHGMATFMATVPALIFGAQVVIGERFSASDYFSEAARYGATVGVVVHAIVPFIKASPPRSSDRAHRVRVLFNAGHDDEFEKRFGVHLAEGFAMTETGFLLYTPFPSRRLGSTGKAHEDWDVCLVDENDNPVPRGQVGELVARPRKSYIMLQGYLNNPGAMADATRNLWWHTGDMLREDEDGYFYFVDRKKERIRRRGQNISSAEIESIANSHPEVVECAVVAHPADALEDEIRLVAVQSGRLSPESFHEWLKARLPNFMVPRYIEFLSSLPRTGTGKIQKVQIVQHGLGTGAWDAQAAGRGAKSVGQLKAR